MDDSRRRASSATNADRGAPGARTSDAAVRRAARSIALAVAVVAAFASITGVAGAHTWSLTKEFGASPDSVAAAPNPAGDFYGNSGVWAIGYGGGGSYTTGKEGIAYSGVSEFTPAATSDWRPGAEFPFLSNPAIEGWAHENIFPFVGVNTAGETLGVWPGETVFLHPAEDASADPPRATAAWVSPVTGTVSIEATFSDVDCGGGDGIDYSVDRLQGGGSTVTHLAGRAVGFCGTGSYNSGNVAVTKGDAYYFSVGDGGGGDISFDSTALTVNVTDGASEPLTVTVPSRETATYKHAIAPVTVSASDSDRDPVTLSAANVPAGLSFNAATGTLSGAPTAPAGVYVITFTADDGHGETVAARTRVTVERGACTVVNKLSQLGTSKGVTLSAKLYEAGTKTAIAGRQLSFGAASASAVAGFGPFIGKTGSTGVGKAKVVLPADVYWTSVEFGGDADYAPCAASPGILTISPSTYTVTGAGTIAIANTKAFFGLNAAQGAELTGQALISTPAGTLTVPDMSSSTLSRPTATSVALSGMGWWNGGWAEYAITISDPATGADTIAITIGSEGSLWSSGGASVVKGGDAKVH